MEKAYKVQVGVISLFSAQTTRVKERNINRRMFMLISEGGGGAQY